MPATTRIAYERGIREWLPRILFGADAEQQKRGAHGAAKPVDLGGLAALPTADVVRAEA